MADFVLRASPPLTPPPPPPLMVNNTEHKMNTQ